MVMTVSPFDESPLRLDSPTYARQREAVPRPDPVPSPRLSVRRRFWRVFRLLALLSVVVAIIAVVLVAQGDPQTHIHMLAATFLGVSLTMLVGTSLMTLTFLSSSSGHDQQASAASSTKKDRQ
jgi:magnesium-transporting ATPase (P-type)